MPTTTARTFRVFVSSTFEDLKEERDALQRDVFPKLRALCEQHGARFQAIDLRWGVRDEAALDQKTMEICLREIDRCQRTGIKPNFIVLLGQRYGWRPLPSRVEAGEFEAVLKQIADGEDRALAESWYQRDDNEVPAEYLLKARVAEWVQAEHWQALETRLHRILRDAAQAAGLSEEARVKFEASATHQEILKGLGAMPEDRRHVFAFCRNASDKDCDPDLVNLKRLLHERLPAGTVLNYEPGDFAKLCREVEQTLRAVIESEAAGFESRPALALEIEAHDAFARERALVFGREDVLEGIAIYLREGGARPLVLHGTAGSGKSAVMAQASERTRTALESAVMVRRFIGGSPESSNGLTLLRGLCEQIGEAYGTTSDLAVDFDDTVRSFRERLARATPARPLVVFLDALDRLGKDDPAGTLAWLAGTLPPHCRIVVSTTELAPVLDQGVTIELKALLQADAATALDHWLQEAHRQLQPGQRERILSAFVGCGLPLYLKLAFEEARGWPSRRTPEACPLGEGVGGVIDSLLKRLSLESNHGPLMVSRSLGYLAAARYGLTEDEIIEVLSADEEVWRDFARRSHHTPPEHRLPPIVWSRLFLDLEPYLSEHTVPGGTTISFFHQHMHVAVRDLWLATDLRAHQELARHFARQKYFFEGPEEQRLRAHRLPPSPRQVNLRKADELLWQRLQAQQWNEVGRLLIDLSFLEAKAEAGRVFDLVDEIVEAARKAPMERRRSLRLMIEALRRDIHLIERHPTALFQCLWNALAWQDEPSQESLASEEDGATKKKPPANDAYSWSRLLVEQWRQVSEDTRGPWLRSLRRPQVQRGQGQSAVLSGHRDRVPAVRYSPNGARVASAAWDRTVRIWNAATGKQEGFLAHEDQVLTCAFSPDGRFVASGADDGTVRMWDVAAMRQVRVWHLHPEKRRGPVMCVSFSPDGKRIAAAFGVGMTWSADDSGLEECVFFTGHTPYCYCVAWAPGDGHIVSGGRDGMVRIWDARSGVETSSFRGHTDAVVSVAYSSDGGFVASASFDRTVRLWDPSTHEQIRVLKGHDGRVGDVAISNDGRRIASASWDSKVRLWSVAGKQLAIYAGHENWVHSVDFAPDNSSIVSGSNDRTVRIWDTSVRVTQPPAVGHEDAILSAAFSPDGTRLATGGRDSAILLWNIDARGSVPTRVGSHGGKLDNETSQYPPWICSLAFSPNGQTLASASLDGNLSLWETATWRLISRSDVRGLPLRVVRFSPDGSLILTVRGQSITIRDIRTGGKTSSFVVRAPEPDIHLESGDCAAFSDDGRLVAVGFYPGAISVWDWKNETEIAFFSADPMHVEDVAFSQDGTSVIAALEDDSVWAWHVVWRECLWQRRGTGEARQRVSSPELVPWRVSWSGSELAVVSGASDKPAAWIEAIPGTTPGRKHVLASHPSGRIWAFASGSHLSLIQLESSESSTM